MIVAYQSKPIIFLKKHKRKMQAQMRFYFKGNMKNKKLKKNDN